MQGIVQAMRIHIALFLVAITVILHAVGLAIILKAFRYLADKGSDFLRITFLIIILTWFLIVIHTVEISVWALFYWWQHCLPDLESAFYFSSVTYTTIGYGDLLLPLKWRMLGAVEGLTGILMCGLSTAFFFAAMSQMYRVRAGKDQG